MRFLSENLFRLGAIMAGTLAWTEQARAADPLVIRGDQALPLLSEVPVSVNSSYEIFTVRPRRTARDELISILGNADLFLTPPPEGLGGMGTEAQKVEKVHSGDEQ